MAEEPAVPEVPQEPVAPETPAETAPAEQAKPTRSVEELEAELAKTRREAANYRVKLKEVEPIAKKALEAEEAEKTEIQKADERAQAAEKREKETLEGYQRLELAVHYHIEPEDIDLIGAGTREEMDARAQRLAALTAAAAKATPPPTNQPVEGLRPGASPEPARAPDDSYPEEWKPAYLRDNERRSFHGQ
jgi:hypothetical protein